MCAYLLTLLNEIILRHIVLYIPEFRDIRAYFTCMFSRHTQITRDNVALISSKGLKLLTKHFTRYKFL